MGGFNCNPPSLRCRPFTFHQLRVLPGSCDILTMALCGFSADVVTRGLAPGVWLALGLSPPTCCGPRTRTACFPRHGLCGSRAGCWAGAGPGKPTRQTLTCPQTSSPTPTNRHQSHCSVDSGEQLKGFPPNWTMTICMRGVGRRRVQWQAQPPPVRAPLSSRPPWSESGVLLVPPRQIHPLSSFCKLDT